MKAKQERREKCMDWQKTMKPTLEKRAKFNNRKGRRAAQRLRAIA